MNLEHSSRRTTLILAAAVALTTVGIATAQTDDQDLQVVAQEALGVRNVFEGNDFNAKDNPFVQPQDPALSGGDRDQSLQFGDILPGTNRDDLLIGNLGIDLLFGGNGNDVLIGGTEHFNPFNRDRGFGGNGKDIFVWAPGDGSDFFSGGRGFDAVVFGLTGEIEDGATVFRVSTDQEAGVLDLDPATGLPQVDVSGSPGFCDVIDRRTSAESRDFLRELDLDHLVRFSIRGIADAFEDGEQEDDNGLRVTLHLQDVELLVCTNRDGGQVELLDLRTSPARPITWGQIPGSVRRRLQTMVF